MLADAHISSLGYLCYHLCVLFVFSVFAIFCRFRHLERGIKSLTLEVTFIKNMH